MRGSHCNSREAEASYELTHAAICRELREKRDISQTKLAELGPNRNYVGDVERGRRNPCLDNILKLAETLDVPPSELFRPFEKRR